MNTTHQNDVVQEFHLRSFESQNTYVCSVRICPDSEGGFTAYCTNLRGVISEGDTLEEAQHNIRDAFREAIQFYLSEGGEIPWGPVAHDMVGTEYHFLESFGG